MRAVEQAVSVRARIAAATGPIHQALHGDPVLGALTRADLAPPTYRAALAVFCTFYQGVEREQHRMGAWPEFGLGAECQALVADLGAAAPPTDLRFGNGAALLGGLYVAHGASFGRGSFRANVARALPEASQVFVRLRSDPATWRALVAAMEDMGADPQGFADLANGARSAFGAVARLSAGAVISPDARTDAPPPLPRDRHGHEAGLR